MKKNIFLSCMALLAVLCFSVPTAAREKQGQPLREYISAQDNSYAWTVTDSMRFDGVMAYRLRLVSQTWREFPWIHELNVFVPDDLRHSEALLHVTGGSADDKTGEPRFHKWDEMVFQRMAHAAQHCNAVAAVLWQVPRQPLYGGLYEDALMSYTFHQYQQTGDKTWPLIFPMTKSVIRAMDAIGEFANGKALPVPVDKYVVNGISKRGWTTWMTAATQDKRVVAIAPMVIDILNMAVNVPYQKHMYGDFSIEIRDYVNLGLTDLVSSTKGKGLISMVDPYSYRKQYTMPKWLVLATNDQYWTVDAVKNYMYGIPGEVRITYAPNSNHSVGGLEATAAALEAFFHYTIHGKKYPSCQSKVTGRNGDFALRLKTGMGELQAVQLWQAESDSKEFRKSTFKPVDLPLPEKKKFTVPVTLPQKGYKAFFVMLTYKHPAGYDNYTLCTRMYTADANTIFDAPFQADPILLEE